MKTIKLDQMAGEIVLAFQEYTDSVMEEIAEKTIERANDMRDEIEDKSPVDTGVYAAGWRVRRKRTPTSITCTIYQHAKPSIVHLLEMDFKHYRVSVPIAARPHLRPAFDKYAPLLEKEIEGILKKGGR